MGVNGCVLRRLNNVKTYLVYHVDKGLGIISGEMPYHLDLIRVREDGYYQGYTLVRGK